MNEFLRKFSACYKNIGELPKEDRNIDRKHPKDSISLRSKDSGKDIGFKDGTDSDCCKVDIAKSPVIELSRSNTNTKTANGYVDDDDVILIIDKNSKLDAKADAKHVPKGFDDTDIKRIEHAIREYRCKSGVYLLLERWQRVAIYNVAAML